MKEVGGNGGLEERRTSSEMNRERTKLRERRRRSITTKIFNGLRKHGNYNLPARADINDVLRALAAESGWIVEPDGTTYRVNPPPNKVPKGASFAFDGPLSCGSAPPASQPGPTSAWLDTTPALDRLATFLSSSGRAHPAISPSGAHLFSSSRYLALVPVPSSQHLTPCWDAASCPDINGVSALGVGLGPHLAMASQHLPYPSFQEARASNTTTPPIPSSQRPHAGW